MRHSYLTSIGETIGDEHHEPRERAFLAVSFLLFIASALGTIYWCRSMSGGMAMPGGWTMSMAWMSMPGQSWLGMAGTFIAMWIVMMVAMMLPSLVPMLSSYRRSIRGWDQVRMGRLTVLAGAGYFFVWTAFGVVAYSVGLVLAAAAMRWPALARSVPVATGVVLLFAGCVQLTTWKARQLGRCRDTPSCEQSLLPNGSTAWQHGLCLGIRCGLCCSGFMMILLVTGAMNLSAMAIITIAITVERLLPRPQSAARATGFIIIAVGILVLVRALGPA